MRDDERARVLVVDDNRLNRTMLTRGVEREGHAVVVAADGREALARLREEPVDVVLLDIVMPEIDGFQVLIEMRADAALRAIPVIVISALEDMDSMVRAIEMGAVDYLPKPFDPVLLRARLRATLQQKRLRDLEQADLRQEVAMRQSEKLATLGKLSAGVAHELNNPAAAAGRSVKHLTDHVAGLLDDARALFACGLDLDGLAWVRGLARGGEAFAADPLQRADREDAIAGWLERAGATDPYGLAGTLAEIGFDLGGITEGSTRFRDRQLVAALTWIARAALVQELLRDTHRSVERITAIVGALKRYSFMDRAPEGRIDVHAGIDDTLLILRAKLRGVDVRRAYADGLPAIWAFGPELNQVWTNLIDNAADALDGSGSLEIVTAVDGGTVVVTVTDDGPGIPPDLLGQVFDPFVTTKPPGTATGLGLNVAHQPISRCV